eukprot:6179338-Pleurochrysis_carterae.AAC.1
MYSTSSSTCLARVAPRRGRAMASRLPRLYKRVSVGAGNNGGWIVALDDKPIKTPAKKLLELPTRPLAVGIAAEWEAQPRKIVPYTMQLMKLATTAIDQAQFSRRVALTLLLLVQPQ